jgi:hypothetical protein
MDSFETDGVQYDTFNDGPGEPVRLPWWARAGMTSDPYAPDQWRPSVAEQRAELACRTRAGQAAA